jgi:hypothetical protein
VDIGDANNDGRDDLSVIVWDPVPAMIPTGWIPLRRAVVRLQNEDGTLGAPIILSAPNQSMNTVEAVDLDGNGERETGRRLRRRIARLPLERNGVRSHRRARAGRLPRHGDRRHRWQRHPRCLLQLRAKRSTGRSTLLRRTAPSVTPATSRRIPRSRRQRTTRRAANSSWTM